MRNRTEQLGKENPHRGPGAGVGGGVVSDSWDGASDRGIVSKAVHCAAVDNELPVDPGVVHFLDERGNLRDRDVWIQGTMRAVPFARVKLKSRYDFAFCNFEPFL